MSDDLYDQILAAGASGKPWAWEPDHPQYIDGYLYLTGAQWDEVCATYPNYDTEKWAFRPSLIWGIGVRLLEPGVPRKLADGRVIVHSKFLDHVHVFDAQIAEDAGLVECILPLGDREPIDPP